MLKLTKIAKIILIAVTFYLVCAVKMNYEMERVKLATISSEEIKRNIKSNIASDYCCICGLNAERNILRAYDSVNGLGLFNVNTVQLYDMGIDINSNFTDTGSSTRITGNITTSTIHERRICEIAFEEENNVKLDYDIISNLYCEKCLQLILSDENNKSLVLIDYQTKEIYPINEKMKMHFMRDFCIIQHRQKKTVNLMVIYTPTPNNIK